MARRCCRRNWIQRLFFEFLNGGGGACALDFNLVFDASAFISDSAYRDFDSSWYACAFDQQIMRSTNQGQTWGFVTSPTNFNWRSIDAAPDGVLFCVSRGGPNVNNSAIRSVDGINWNQIVIPRRFWNDVAHIRNQIWIAVTDNGTASERIMRSTDNGLSWSLIPISERVLLNAVASDGNGVVVAVGYDNVDGNDRIWRSIDDGATWTGILAPTPPDSLVPQVGWVSVATDKNGVWCACSMNGDELQGAIMRSADNGLTWDIVPNPFPQNSWGDINTDGNGTWIATASSEGTPDPRKMVISRDNGLTWEPIEDSVANSVGAISTNKNGSWIAAVGQTIELANNC